MFEVDWQDYNCERVGQRRVRKEAEKEQKKNNDASSGHRTNSTLSTRTSSSSDQHHRKFFGSIGRKKPAASLKSTKSEAIIPKFESTKANGAFKRGSLRFSGIATTMMAPPTANASVGLENKPPNIQPSSTLRNIADVMQSNSPQSVDRSSKESMLSRMTQLTVPTLESQGDEPTNDATTEINLIQALDDRGSSVNKVVTTTYEHGETDPFVSTRSGVGTQITAGSRIPRKTGLSRVMHSAPSPADGAKSASELIDDWFTALHNPAARPALKPGPNGTTRSGGVLLPPNVIRRALPETPTRQSIKKSNAGFLPAKPSLIRFSADNPDDWQPMTQQKRAPSDGARASAPAKEQASMQDEEIMRLMAADLKDIHVQEEVAREGGATRWNTDTLRAKRSAGYAAEPSPRLASMEKNAETVKKSGRPVRPAI